MENLSKTYLMVDRITNYIKIGKSKDVFYREKTLQAEKPTIEGLFYVEEDIEKLLHFLFAEKRLRGEWFNLNQEDIDCIDQILAQKGLIKKEFSLNDVVKVRPKKRNYETVSKRPQSEIIYESQHNTDVVILNSPLSAPKLVRKLDNGKDIQFSEIYTPKIFYDIISRITPEYLQALEDGKEPLLITIYIGAFLNSISPGKSNSLYRHVIDCIDLLQTTQVKWKDTEKEKGTAIITHYEYHPRQGKVDIVLYKEFVKQVVLVTQNEHFSFLKKHLNQLQNAQAIRLFPFFVSWSNKGMIEMNLDVFKKKFGCDTEGYKKFRNLNVYILDPALKEINEKTDLTISYKLLGKNLTGQRQRVTGLQFFISEKTKQKELSEAEKTFFEVAETAPQVIKPIAAEPKGEYLEEILRIFLVFEPQSTSENIKGFLSAFESSKAVVEACLYAEQEQAKGNQIKNFRGYLVSGIPKGLGSGMLEQKTKEQAQKQKIEQRKKAEAEKVIQLENLLKQADDLRIAYQKGINQVIRNTATEADKDKVADILRGQNSIYAKRTLDDFRKPMLVGIFIGKFIETYPERFEAVQNTYKPPFQAIMSAIKKLDPTKCKELFY